MNKLSNSNEDKWIDFSGTSTGIPLTKDKVISFLIGVALIPFFWGLGLVFEQVQTGLAVGIIASGLYLMIRGVLGFGVSGAYICILAILAGLLNVSDMVAGSLFFQFVGLCMIGYGAEATPFGQRLAYFMLKHSADHPYKIVGAFLLVSAFLSSFLSNTAAMVLMASICHNVMKQMGQQPGRSGFGAACMIACAIGPNIGCIGFIQGSTGINIFSVEQIKAVTKGQYTITPGQWASVGWIALIILLPVAFFIIMKTVRFDPSEVDLPQKSFYEQKLNEMGPMGGSEKRWLIYLASLIALMVVGVNVVMLMLIYIILATLPGIGFMNTKTAFQKAVPWETVFCSVTLAMIGTILSNAGLTEQISKVFLPIIGDKHPLIIMLALALFIAVLSMYVIGSTFANIAIGVTMTAPLVEALGLNPSIMLFPVINSINYMIGIFAMPIMMLNYQYGYWKKSQITKTGTLVTLAAVLINCLVTYYLAPVLWNVPLRIQ